MQPGQHRWRQSFSITRAFAIIVSSHLARSKPQLQDRPSGGFHPAAGGRAARSARPAQPCSAPARSARPARSGLGAVDSTIEDITVTTARGTGLRRLVAQQLVRETVIIPLQPAASQQLAVWTNSHNDEPFWLDEDLHSRGLSPLAALWQK